MAAAAILNLLLLLIIVTRVIFCSSCLHFCKISLI